MGQLMTGPNVDGRELPTLEVSKCNFLSARRKNRDEISRCTDTVRGGVMTAIAGAISTNGDKTDKGALKNALQSLSQYGKDRTQQWSDARSSLLIAQTWFTPEDGKDKQPLIHDALSSVAFVGDLRIDNRPELLAAHFKNDKLLQTAADSELFFRLYLRMGCRCFKQILGKFAVAIWDRKRETLTLARSPFFSGTLYWHRDHSQICFSSLAKVIFLLSGCARRANEETYSLGPWPIKRMKGGTHYFRTYRKSKTEAM